MSKATIRVGIDARLVRVPRGIGNAIQGLLNGLSRISPNHEILIYTDSSLEAGKIPDAPGFTLRILRPAVYPYWEQVAFPIALARDRIDVVHCPGNTGPLWGLGRTRLVVTIHDAIYFNKEFRKGQSAVGAMQAAYYRANVPMVASRAQAIITVSEFSRNDIIRLMHVAPSKISIIHIAPGEDFRRISQAQQQQVKQKYGLDRYIIAPAAIDPRKNTLRLLTAFAEFLRNADSLCVLVLVGLDNRARLQFERVCGQLNIRSHIKLLGFVATDELVALNNGAEFALYLSCYEGFGLPVLEAMACGVPVIAANATSIPEVAGDAALLVDPYDVEMIVEAMRRLSGDAALRALLRARGEEQAKKFSWDAAARQTLAIYESL